MNKINKNKQKKQLKKKHKKHTNSETHLCIYRKPIKTDLETVIYKQKVFKGKKCPDKAL